MGRSLALGLYLLLAERGGPLAAGARPPRPAGRLLWIHAAREERAGVLGQLLRLLRREDAALKILLTRDVASDEAVGETVSDMLPADRLPDVRAFLDHWRPTAGLFLGTALPAALIAEAHERRIPLMLADAMLQADLVPFWRRGMAGSVLGRFSRILARDAETVRALRRIGGRTLPVELGGRIEEAADPLACVEAEREAFAELLRARPVWLAAACPEAEEDAVLAAHVHAMQHAHRLLLILSPADPARAPGLAQALTEQGFIVAERAADQEPLRDVQVLVTDGPTELGLWYRLAPVAFMGGTLAGTAPGRDPAEAAALGSAVVHGPQTGPHRAAYNRLGESRAARPVANAEELAAAIADLIAPDRAAVLAHNAWTATSGGAEVAERVVRIALDALGAAAPEGQDG